jgi:Fic family protein
LKNFDYSKILDRKFSSTVLSLISEIYEHKGKQNLFLMQKAESLESLVNIAKVQSTEASNRIEGIVTTEKRINEIMQEKTMPKTRDEEEIMGYRDVLNTIHENYEHIKTSSSFILQLHRDLYKYSSGQFAGKFKSVDNFIQEEDSLGNKRIKFAPLAAYLTPNAMEKVCIEYAKAKNTLQVEPLILIPIFILDFLCIHPFNDGNGRMSRLLTLLLLYQNEFMVGKYISLEKIIASTKEDYYDVLERSSNAWHENQNDPMYFVEYMLRIILNAYKQFEERVITVESFKLTKAEQVRNVFQTKLGKVSKKEIKTLLPHISEAMIEVTLKSLLDENYIEKIGAGKNTKYAKIN